MSTDLYEKSLQQQVKDGSLTRVQMTDLLAQKKLFDANRKSIEAQHDKKVVGYCNGEIYVDQSMRLLLTKTQATHPGRMLYFETVGYSLFG